MERKEFIRNGFLAALSLPVDTRTKEPDPHSMALKRPPFLKAGDTIAISSPAGYITLEELEPAIRQISSWGLKVKLGATIGRRDGTFGGTDTERLEDLQALIDDHSVNAILCARGGYGLVRIIDHIDFNRFRRHPKWLIGFSDVTVLHAHLNSVVRVASIHSKMCNSFPDIWEEADQLQKDSILSIRDLLMGKSMYFSVPPSEYNRYGQAKGELIGGNCKTIESITGSGSDLLTKGKILFLEDTGEYLYSIDRMFWNLKRSGKLDHLAGLVIGGFKFKPSEDPEEEFNRNVYQIIMEKLVDCHYPVCFEFPVGHQKNNFALKCGAMVKLDVNATGSVLQE